MARTVGHVVAMALGACTLQTTSAFGQTDTRAAVVVHLTDFANLEASDVATARDRVTRVYAEAGVAIAWATGWARSAPTDDRWHVDLLLLDAAMSARYDAEPDELGRASHATRRAYVFTGRIAMHARTTHSEPAWALAFVMAHELGHVLLPEYSHSPFGLMRAEWAGPLRRIPRFAPSEAAALRRMVSAGR